MKIKTDFPHTIIYSLKLCDIVGLIHRTKKQRAMGFAFPPNIIVLREKSHPMNEQWLIHEKIHHRQNWETLWLIHILNFCQYWKARLSGKGHTEAYFSKSA